MMNKHDSLSPQNNLNPAIAGGAGERQREGVDLDAVAPGSILELQTGHNLYRLENLGDGKALISGHPTYCPQPVVAEIQGSIGTTGFLQWHFIEKGNGLVFLLGEHGPVRTSRITEIRTSKPGPHSSN